MYPEKIQKFGPVTWLGPCPHCKTNNAIELIKVNGFFDVNCHNCAKEMTLMVNIDTQKVRLVRIADIKWEYIKEVEQEK